MPVQFRRDELQAPNNDVQQTVVWEADAPTRIGSAARAIVAGLWVSIPGAVGLCFGLSLMRRALLAAEVLSKDNDFWRETWLPFLLFCFYGAILGAGIAWRVTSTVSLGGLAVWLATGANIALVVLVGACASLLVVFTGAVPSTCWIGLALVAGAAVAGVHALNAWND
jgi:hypothetical protein